MNGTGDIPISNGTATERPCGLTSIIPSIGMSCRGRAEAFARRLQSKLRTLGSQNGDDSPTNEDDPIMNGTSNSWIIHNDQTNQVVVTAIQPLPLRHNQTNLSNQQADTADSFFDFDCCDDEEEDEIESPGSPIDECEYSRLIETTSNTPHDCATESGYICSSPVTPIGDLNNGSRSSSHSSDGPYFDPESSDNGSIHHLTTTTTTATTNGITIKQNGNSGNTNYLSRTPTDYYDCIELNKVENDLDKLATIIKINGHDREYKNVNNINSNHTETTTQHMLNGGEPEEHIYVNGFMDQKMESNTDSCDSSADSLPPSQESTTGDAVTPTNGIDTTDFISTKIQSIITEHNNDSQQEQNELNDKSTDNLINGKPDISVTAPSPIDDRIDNDDEHLLKLKLQIDAAVDAVIHDTIESPLIENDEQMLIANQKDEIDFKEKQQQNLCDTDEEDEMRPQRVRRCSSLKTGKTPPGTPGRKKIVRFADVLGLDLADVKTFLDEIPNVPISAYQDLEIIESEPPIQLGPKADKILMPLFQQPGGLPSFLDIVRIKQVNLENAIITDHLNLTINGLVRVCNLDFHKSVHIRYTTDSWRTFNDLCASYVTNSCDGFSDKFVFTLCCNHLMVGQRLEFAVRFQCKGQQFWDNNYGSNYCFQCLPTSTTTTHSTLVAASSPLLSSSSSSITTTNAVNNLSFQQRPILPHNHLPNNSSAILNPSTLTSDAWCVSFY